MQDAFITSYWMSNQLHNLGCFAPKFGNILCSVQQGYIKCPLPLHSFNGSILQMKRQTLERLDCHCYFLSDSDWQQHSDF